MTSQQPEALPQWAVTREGDVVALTMTGAWNDPTHLPASRQVWSAIHKVAALGIQDEAAAGIRVDAAVAAWHPALAALLFGVRRHAETAHLPVTWLNLPAGLADLLASARSAPAADSHHNRRKLGHHHHIVAGVGAWGQGRVTRWADAIATAGELTLAGLAAIGPRSHARRKDFIALLLEVGLNALPITAVVNVLVGGILAFVGAVQLKQFGAQIYIANLVGIAVAREMAAIMTAIVMAGRTGAAYAAHLATMQGNEEIDALKTLAISPFEHLVVPRVGALLLMMPVLYLYATAVGIFGGLVVAVTTTDVSALGYLTQTAGAIGLSHCIIGFVKSICFGALVGVSGCLIGLRAGRSAADVGQAATRAVVVGIVGVIMLDAVFAVCTNVLGI